MTSPNRPPLSPAAQAVMDAFLDSPVDAGNYYATRSRQIAAALRAAADHAVPEAANAVGDEHDEARLDQWLRIRWKLLAIAAELEGTTRDPLEPNDLSHLSEEEFQALAPQGFHGV